MADLAGLIAVIGTFGMAPGIIYLRSRHKLRLRELELQAKALEAGRPAALPPGDGARGAVDAAALAEENRQLRERLERLEAIVTSGDFELNQKVARLVEAQQAALPAAGATTGAGTGATLGDPAAAPKPRTP